MFVVDSDRAIFLHKNVEDPMEATENPFGTVISKVFEAPEED